MPHLPIKKKSFSPVELRGQIYDIVTLDSLIHVIAVSFIYIKATAHYTIRPNVIKPDSLKMQICRFRQVAL